MPTLASAGTDGPGSAGPRMCRLRVKRWLQPTKGRILLPAQQSNHPRGICRCVGSGRGSANATSTAVTSAYSMLQAMTSELRSCMAAPWGM